MNVLLLPADDSACRLYRLTAPGRAVEALGVTVEHGEPLRPQRTTLRGEMPVSIDVGDADVVVLQRPVFAAVVDFIPRLQAEGRAVVVDIDDDLSVAHPEHSWSRPKLHLDPPQQMRACELADLVTCTTPALAKHYARPGRVEILPNCVPAALLELPRDSDGFTIGWAGSASGHPGDLPATHGGVADALEGTDWTFKVIGPEETVRKELELTQPPEITGGLSIEDYQLAIGSLDIGIVPLGDTPFNRAKSYLKGLEYAARGVPFVASDLPEYARLAAQGVGLLATSRKEWRHHLDDLMRDESLHIEHAERGRAVLAEKHTYESQAARWPYAWARAIDYRKESR